MSRLGVVLWCQQSPLLQSNSILKAMSLAFILTKKNSFEIVTIISNDHTDCLAVYVDTGNICGYMRAYACS
jgi:hypothetical protein